MLQLANAQDMRFSDGCFLSLATHGTMSLPGVVVDRGGGGPIAAELNQMCPLKQQLLAGMAWPLCAKHRKQCSQ